MSVQSSAVPALAGAAFGTVIDADGQRAKGRLAILPENLNPQHNIRTVPRANYSSIGLGDFTIHENDRSLGLLGNAVEVYYHCTKPTMSSVIVLFGIP